MQVFSENWVSYVNDKIEITEDFGEAKLFSNEKDANNFRENHSLALNSYKCILVQKDKGMILIDWKTKMN